MAEKIIKMYFEFDATSLEYSRFLEACYTSFPEIKFTKEMTRKLWPWITLCTSVPESTAVVLKLAFGPNIHEPVQEEDTDDFLESFRRYQQTKKTPSPKIWPKLPKEYEIDKYKKEDDFIKYKKEYEILEKDFKRWTKIK